ncbi:MAG TPA: DUF1837 domain-containing protein [Allosphingosinicella sp.]|jgi:hypothetical protein
MAELSAEDLVSILAGDPDELQVHLELIERDVAVDGHLVRVHCHCLTVDGNGRVKPHRLAEFMRNAVADYAVPKSQLADARARDHQFRSTSATAELHQQAIRAFTDLEKSGEGGEMLLFLLAERFLKLPQVLCKMDLKTDTRMHYHGADGIYAGVTDEGVLKLFWGESKVYQDASTAIRDCLAALSPFLTEHDHEGAERERDLILLSDKADLSDPKLTDAFKRYFDSKTPQSNRVEYCGLALVGFNASFYPADGTKALADALAESARQGLLNWTKQIGNRLTAEKLDQVHIEFFCVPLPCVDQFRSAFRTSLGLDK